MQTPYGSENKETDEFLTRMAASAVPAPQPSRTRRPVMMCAAFLATCAAGALGLVSERNAVHSTAQVQTANFELQESGSLDVQPSPSSDIVFPWQSIGVNLSATPTPFVANWTAIDTNTDGSISLNELLGYLTTQKDAQVAKIEAAAAAAVAQVQSTFDQHTSCIKTAYSELIDAKTTSDKKEILTASELGSVLMYARDHCYYKTTPTPTTAVDGGDVVIATTTPAPSGATTTTSAPEPSATTTSAPEPSATTTTPAPTTTASWAEPTTTTPSVTFYVPSREEVLKELASSIDVLGNQTNLTKAFALAVLNQTRDNVTAKIDTTWFNSDGERAVARAEVAKYFGTLTSCVSIAMSIFGRYINVLDAFELAPALAWIRTTCMDTSDAKFGKTDTNQNNVIEEFEVMAAIVQIRDNKLAALANVTDPTAYQAAFFATRQLYGQTMECAHNGITQLGDPVARTLSREQFYGLEAWMLSHCSLVEPDVTVVGLLPNATILGGNFSLGNIVTFLADAKTMYTAAVPVNDTYHAATIEDHFRLIEVCLNGSYVQLNVTNETAYASLVTTVQTCVAKSVPVTMPVGVFLSRPEFQALLELTWAAENASLDAQIRQAQAALDKLKAKKAALATCIVQAVDNAAAGEAKIPQSQLVPAQSFTKQCYVKATSA
ncbi:hypothetical protein H310_13868 [Aphanomyces invadans]|uniref:EF-hand domain-containing protein n=1 Tax=Aphanomyces invadans TaxID=157072 RepID=A0A024TC42_9STRA|nr:hypothetical protein H310_13868 [Aphanomyces invadans]ETV91618.1 hypothetical protein H310_13868 [Aphanomyces invadans]|eukprot:XP_008879737.1 hypothetical protein H310_13868 [Aphanomyces invadans]